MIPPPPHPQGSWLRKWWHVTTVFTIFLLFSLFMVFIKKLKATDHPPVKQWSHPLPHRSLWVAGQRRWKWRDPVAERQTCAPSETGLPTGRRRGWPGTGAESPGSRRRKWSWSTPHTPCVLPTHHRRRGCRTWAAGTDGVRMHTE